MAGTAQGRRRCLFTLEAAQCAASSTVSALQEQIAAALCPLPFLLRSALQEQYLELSTWVPPTTTLFGAGTRASRTLHLECALLPGWAAG